MHFLRLPNGLWFLQPGAGSEIQKSVSLTGFISVSASAEIAFTSAQVDRDVLLSYGITCSVVPLASVELELDEVVCRVSASHSVSLLASVDYTGEQFGPLSGFLTVTPVYTLDIAGQVDKDVNATYPLTVSATATVNAFLSVTQTYPLSADPVAAIATTEETLASVSVNGQITASAQILLVISQDNIEKNVSLACGISASTSTSLVIPPPGGLVWSQTKQRYIAVRVGS